MMRYALREFMTPATAKPQFDHADPRQTLLRERDRTSYGFAPPTESEWKVVAK
jgi:hypothetical protein